jgi:hypothetical protein
MSFSPGFARVAAGGLNMSFPPGFARVAAGGESRRWL